ncbi:MAG: type II toxin-antitoxin system death-on-curing family toxin [Candidatus Binatales bacterium]
MKPAWLTKDELIALHDEALAEFGGRTGIRDAGLLENALAKPRNLAAYRDDPSIFDLAAAYSVGIARNRPFVDGNKRMAFLAAAVFLDLNGYELTPTEVEVVDTMIRLAKGAIGQKRLSIWFKNVARNK